jgi:predicted flap endonuclease-1-like 5' DNA nuclease
MPEDRSMQLDGRIALAAGLLLTALLLVTNNVISRVPLADYLLALALTGIGLALIFIRWTPRQSDAEAETIAPQSDLMVVSAPTPEPLPEWTPAAEAETPTVVAAPVEPLPNVETLTLPKAESTEDETQAVESAEVEETTQAVESVEAADETQAVESPVVEEATQAVEPVEPDDLEKINGIGPKIAAALRDLGITTFAALATADEKQLQAALEAAGARRLGDPGFWIRQAEYAARGDWNGMQRVIDEYKAQRGDGS